MRLTLRSRASTPLEPIVRLAGEDDIIDEVIGFFKANVLFKHFEVKGGADRILIYLTLYITQCLQRLEKCPSPTDGMKALTAMAHESFRIQGDAGFALGSFFPSPASSQEAELCRGYAYLPRPPSPSPAWFPRCASNQGPRPWAGTSSSCVKRLAAGSSLGSTVRRGSPPSSGLSSRSESS